MHADIANIQGWQRTVWLKKVLWIEKDSMVNNALLHKTDFFLYHEAKRINTEQQIYEKN